MANEWATAFVIFALTRLVALIGSYAGVTQLIGSDPSRNKGWLAELSLNWDAAWYAGIVRDFYSYSPANPGGDNVAFAPLYPFLIKALSTILNWVTFGWDWGNSAYGSIIAAGLVISNVSFFVALVLLIKLLAPRVGRQGATMVALALAALPLSFFFSALYTEGLFLMLALGCFVLARSEWRWKWLCAGLVGMLASLDRYAGVFLFPALLVEYLSQTGWRPRRVRPDLLWLALVPIGAGIFAAFLWLHFGTTDVLADTMRKGWNHQPSFFLGTYWTSGTQLWDSVRHAYPAGQDPVLYYGNGNRLYAIMDLATPLLLLAGAIVAARKLLLSEWVWLLCGIIYPLSTNTTFSLARYMLPLWPGLIWLGALQGRWRWLALPWVIMSLGLLLWCSSIYGGARWIG